MLTLHFTPYFLTFNKRFPAKGVINTMEQFSKKVLLFYQTKVFSEGVFELNTKPLAVFLQVVKFLIPNFKKVRTSRLTVNKNVKVSNFSQTPDETIYF